MHLVYLDFNCFQRSFDDPRQLRIQLEAVACQEIFDRTECGELELVWSFIHNDEAAQCPIPNRQIESLRLSQLCHVRVGPSEQIRRLAKTFSVTGRLSPKDALHVACADASGADYFLTCDDRLRKQSLRLKRRMSVLNPVDYVREEQKNEK